MSINFNFTIKVSLGNGFRPECRARTSCAGACPPGRNRGSRGAAVKRARARVQSEHALAHSALKQAAGQKQVEHDRAQRGGPADPASRGAIRENFYHPAAEALLR